MGEETQGRCHGEHVIRAWESNNRAVREEGDTVLQASKMERLRSGCSHLRFFVENQVAGTAKERGKKRHAIRLERKDMNVRSSELISDDMTAEQGLGSHDGTTMNEGPSVGSLPLCCCHAMLCSLEFHLRSTGARNCITIVTANLWANCTG